MEEHVTAPIRSGDVLGYLVYKLNHEEIGRTAIVAVKDIEEAGFADYWKKLWGITMLSLQKGTP